MDDSNIKLLSPEERLNELYNRKQYIISSLTSIDIALSEESESFDQLFGAYSDNVVRKPKPKQSGLRIRNALSFRGIEKACEYFEHLDEDKDNRLCFEDFYAMKSLIEPNGIVTDPEYCDIESWQIYLSNFNIRTDGERKIDLEAFCYYRSLIELKRSLAYELDILKMTHLPRKLAQWSRIKLLIDEIYEHRSLTQSNLNIGNKLDLDDVAYILSNENIIFSRHELLLRMLTRAKFAKVIEEIFKFSLRKNYGHELNRYVKELDEKGFGILTKPVILMIESIRYVSPSQLIAWIFAKEEIESYCTYSLGLLLQTKYYIWNRIRYFDKLSRVVYDMGTHVRSRKVYHGMTPLDKIQRKFERSFFNYNVNLGLQDANIEDGLAVTWNLSRVFRPEEYCKNIKVPRDSGIVLSIDISVREDMSDDEMSKTADSLFQFLKNNFDDELKKNAQYRGLFCFPGESDLDGSRILRIALVYHRLVSIDSFFAYSLVPYRLFDMVTDFSGELHTSISLYDILHSWTPLDVILSAKLMTRATFMREGILTLLMRTYKAFNANISHYEVDPPTDPDTKREISLWSKYQDYFAYAKDLCKVCLTMLRGIKTVSSSFTYNSLSELLRLFGLDNYFVKQYFPEELGTVKGFISSLYHEYKTKLSDDIDDLFQMCKTFMEEKIAIDENERMKILLMTRVQRESAASTHKSDIVKEDITQKLKKVGIDFRQEDIVRNDSTDIDSFVKESYDHHCNKSIQGLIAYEKFKKSCLGLRSIDFLCGYSKLSVSFQGLDFCDYLPDAPPIIHEKHEFDHKKRRAETLLKQYLF
jgi:hypothetical protein